MQEIKRNRENRDIWQLGFFCLAVIAFPAFLSIIPRQLSGTRSLSLDSPACTDHFDIHTYNGAKSDDPLLIGEIHKIDERYNANHVADCLTSLAQDGDQLLIEAYIEGREAECSFIDSAYQRFNGKLKCYGFDVAPDENQRIYTDLALKANLLVKLAQNPLFFGVESPKEFRAKLIMVSEKLQQQKSSSSVDQDHSKRLGKYLGNLARKLSGLTIREIEHFIFKEHKQLVDKVEKYEKLSRHGKTDKSFLSHLKNHQEQLAGSKYRLFAVAGAQHLDPLHNPYLQTAIDSHEPFTILMPKRYGR